MKLFRNFVLLLLVGITSLASADWYIGWERQEIYFYGVSIDGVRSGWAEESVWKHNDRIKTQKIQEMKLSRGGMEISIKVASVFIETPDGTPISVSSTQEAMGQSQETTWVFKDGMIEMTSAAGGNPVLKTIPMPEGAWLTPQAVRRMFKNKMDAGATEITYQTMALELGPKLVTVLMTKLGDEVRDILGNEIRVSKWETVNDIIPIAGIEWYTKDGLNVSSSVNAGFGDITNTIMPKHLALAPVIEVPELMVSLFVEPNKSIPNNSELSRLVMRVKSKDGTKLELPSVGFQQAIMHEDGSVTLVIDLDQPITATKEESANAAFSAATSICDGKDAAVASIAKAAVATLSEDASDMQIGLALRAKVFDYIDNKGMSTAFASASQTARDRKGDCSEHAVLLCGVLRAAGIPSRGVMGMVYIPNYSKPNGVFGWHMWSQALIDGKWIDLDATLQTPFNVGHIATVTTSLSDEGLAAEMSGIITTIGNIDVEVIQIGSAEE